MRNTTWIIDPVPPRSPRVWHALHGAGRIVCDTSDTAWGAPRVIVEWDNGTKSKVCESELRYRAPRP